MDQKIKYGITTSLIIHLILVLSIQNPSSENKQEVIEITVSSIPKMIEQSVLPQVHDSKPKQNVPSHKKIAQKNEKYKFLSGDETCMDKTYSGIGLIMGSSVKDKMAMAIVETVMPGGPAFKAGIKVGDYVDPVHIGKGKLQKGDKIDLMYSSKGEIKFTTIVAAEICYSFEAVGYNN